MHVAILPHGAPGGPITPPSQGEAVASHLDAINFDCHDPLALARFWAAVLGYVEDPAEPNVAGSDEAWIQDPKRLKPALLFITVPEGKTVKNRVHLDLNASANRDQEVERVLGLGATFVADHRDEDGTGWVVLADPEGNEFCICRSDAERGHPEPADTGHREFPPTRTSSERTQVESLLEWYRAGVERKVAGVSQEVATTRPLASDTSIAGLVKHLAMVEDTWFGVRFAGEAPADWYAGTDWDADPDWEFDSAEHEPIELQLERYRAACDRARSIAAAADLEDAAVNDEGRPFVLRFILLHLLEETARHLGHLDVLRELLDGTRGE